MKKTNVYLLVAGGRIQGAVTNRRDARAWKSPDEIVIPVTLTAAVTQQIRATKNAN